MINKSTVIILDYRIHRSFFLRISRAREMRKNKKPVVKISHLHLTPSWIWLRLWQRHCVVALIHRIGVHRDSRTACSLMSCDCQRITWHQTNLKYNRPVTSAPFTRYNRILVLFNVATQRMCYSCFGRETKWSWKWLAGKMWSFSNLHIRNSLKINQLSQFISMILL